jgi:hypothetical protein
MSTAFFKSVKLNIQHRVNFIIITFVEKWSTTNMYLNFLVVSMKSWRSRQHDKIRSRSVTWISGFQTIFGITSPGDWPCTHNLLLSCSVMMQNTWSRCEALSKRGTNDWLAARCDVASESFIQSMCCAPPPFPVIHRDSLTSCRLITSQVLPSGVLTNPAPSSALLHPTFDRGKALPKPTSCTSR